MLIALLAAAGAAQAAASTTTPLPTTTDELRQELEAEGDFLDVLAFWRVDDGWTVSALWRFTTPDRNSIQPAIEGPAPVSTPRARGTIRASGTGRATFIPGRCS